MSRRRGLLTALAAVCAVSGPGCGSGSTTGPSGTSTHTSPNRTAASPTAQAPPKAPPAGSPAARLTLRATAAPPLPEGRSGIAATAYEAGAVALGGLSPAGVSTATAFTLSPSGNSTPLPPLPPLPGPVHDAAAAAVAGRLLVFGGGRYEGSDRVVQVAPGAPRVVGRLPQPLSDLVAAPIGATAYVLGGWNGANTSATIYAATATGKVGIVGRLPLGLRYPAAAALGGRVIVAGGETTASEPVSRAWSFDPGTGSTTQLPSLPVPTDHAAAAAMAGRVFVIGGLRRGQFTDAILSWSPGERRWQVAGRLATPLADMGAVAVGDEILVIGGRDGGGRVASVQRLRPS
jgi:hypothetical protein